MQHVCTLVPNRDSLSQFFEKNLFRRMKKWVVISPDNPLCVKYFRSEKAVNKEMRRQLEESNACVIHPLSKFRMRYELYLIFLYFFNLIFKPTEAAYVMRESDAPFTILYTVSCSLNLLNYIDIMINFMTGYIVTKANRIELRSKYIAKNYVKSVYFYSDIFSSIPRLYGLAGMRNSHDWYVVSANFLALCYIIRLASLIVCIQRISDYCRWNMKEKLLLLYCALITAIIVHWITCLQCMIPVFGYHYWYDQYTKDLYEEFKDQPTFDLLYKDAFMKTSAEILGVRNDGHDASVFPMIVIEDYVIAMFTYLLGKILMASIWIILAMSIMNKRSMEIKFVEIINQLEAYMSQKGFTMNLREKLLSYYQFKFQNKFFKEKYVHELLSNELHKEVNIHVCRSLISNVKIFASMTPEQVTELVPKLIPEIFLPRETIYRAGSEAEHMYFVSSGTVAVYTRSGKEVCHIEDGGYFNEIALIMKGFANTCTVISLEMTQVYRLSRKDFEKSLVNFGVIYDILVDQASKKLKIIKKLEEDYKREQFEAKFGRSSTFHASPRRSSSHGLRHRRSASGKNLARTLYDSVIGWKGVSPMMELDDGKDQRDEKSQTNQIASEVTTVASEDSSEENVPA